MNHKELLESFKQEFSKNNPSLDFRTDVFLENQYGLSPSISYNRAKDIVIEVYAWAHEYIEENEEQYPDFSGWQFNTEMEIEKLRVSKVSQLIDSVIDQLIIRQTKNNIVAPVSENNKTEKELVAKEESASNSFSHRMKH